MTTNDEPKKSLEIARIYFDEARYDEAMAIIERLVESECGPAMTLLGSAYHLGLGKPVDGRAAIRWYQKAMELGEGLAAHNLGVLLLSGMPGVTIDKARAVKCFAEARRLGCGLLANSEFEE